MSKAYTDLYVHLVWATLGRAPWISDAVEPPLFAALATQCRKLRCPPYAIGGMPDHVHLLVALAPTVSVAGLVQQLKGSSAHLVTHALTPDAPFRWQRGYGAFTLRKSDAPIVRRYVLGQKDHHAKRNLQADWELQEEAPE